MKDSLKTKKQLIEELHTLRERLSEPERLNSGLVGTGEALEEDGDKYKLLISNIPHVTWISDASGNTSFISPNVEKIYGFSAEEIYEGGEGLWFDRVHPDDKEKLINAWKALFEEEMPYDIEYRIRRKDGEWIWLSDKAIEKRDNEGVKVAYGVFTDITERKRAEEALKTSEANFHTILDSANDAILVHDKDTFEVLHVNQKMCEMFGYTKEEAVGLKVKDIIEGSPPYDLDNASKFGKKAMQGEPQLFEFKLRKKSGEPFWVEVSLKRISIGGEWRLLAIDRDITERKRAEEALESSQKILRTVLDTVPARVFWKDLDLKYLGCNIAFARDAGLSAPGELIGKDDFQMSWKNEAELYRSDDRRVMDSGEPKLNYDEPQSWPDGTKLWLRTSKVQLRDTDGKVFGVLGTYEDITERKLMEEALRESEEKYRNLFEGSKDVIFMTAPEGEFLDCNPACLEKLGFSSREEALKINVRDLYKNPDDRKAFQREMVEKGFVKDFEVAFNLKNGQTGTGLITANILRDKNGDIAAYWGVMRDITERKLAERAILEERDRAQSYLDTVESIIVVLDTDGSITGINRKGCEVLGRTENELNGKKWFETCLPKTEESKEVFNAYKKIISGAIEGAEYYENYILTSSGEKRLIAWHNNFLRNKDGEIVGTLSSGEDITERKRAEEEVRTLNEDLEIKVEERTENLNAANKELKRFNNLFVGRELRIKELKARVKELEGKTSPPLNRSM
jgi:PAS domain S-box-containing protein